MAVLIVSYSDDPHVPLVTAHLDHFGVQYCSLVTDQIGALGSTSVRIGGAAARISGPELDLTAVHSVWNRRVFVDPGWSTDPGPDPMRDRHVHDQRLALVHGLLGMVPPGARWVNRFDSGRLAGAKPAQLELARSLGLKIPDTLVSDDPCAIREFADIHRRSGLITKLVAGTPSRVPNGVEQFSVFTTEIDPSHVSDGALSAAPAIYQPRVQKRCEARAVVVGDRVLTCAIDSQASVDTRLDWRRYDFDHVAHYEIELPAAVNDRLVALTKALGLVYGAVDLAQCVDGSWLFFELNPAGQWAWLEHLAGVPIGAALAEALADGA